MVISKLRILFSALWFLLAMLCIAIAYSVTYEGTLSFTANGIDQTTTLGFMYFLVGLVLSIVSVGIYVQNKLALLVIIPVLAFSIVWFIDVVTAEQIWFKYIVSSVVLLTICIGSVLSLLRST